MKGFRTMLQMNLKMLIRNKGYLACLVIIPLIAVLMLTTVGFASDGSVDLSGEIQEWTDGEHKICTSNDTMMIKVYDECQTEVSEYLLQQLIRSGLYVIYREKTTDVTQEQIKKDAKNLFESSSIRAILYIPADFSSEPVKDGEVNVQIYQGYEDQRICIVCEEIEKICQVIDGYSQMNQGDMEQVIQALQEQETKQTDAKIITMKKASTLNLNTEQLEQSSQIGYSLAFLTGSFIFSGVFIAYIVIHEYENKTMNRFELSMSTKVCYFLVKICCVTLTSFLQIIVVGIGIVTIVRADFGISLWEFLFFAFLQGLIFNLLSVVIGLIVNNVLVTTLVSFLIYTISSLLAGLYFPLSEDGVWGKLAKLFPQHWMLHASEMLMVGKTGVNTMYVLVILAFLLVLTTVGLVAAKVRAASVTA